MRHGPQRPVVCLAWCVAAVLGAASAVPGQTAPTRSPCQGYVVGRQHPHLLPAHAVWEALFAASDAADRVGRRVELAADLGLNETLIERLVSAGKDVLTRALAFRNAEPVRDRDTKAGLEHRAAAADMILQARDDLLRRLSPDEAGLLLKSAATRRRSLSVPLDAPGTTAGPGSVPPGPCRVEVSGRDYPHLIPEDYFWEFYLRFESSAARDYIQPDGQYSPEYIRTLQKHHLPIPEREIRHVIDTARDATTRVDELRATVGVDPQALEAQVSAIVEGARTSLLRELPRASWLTVLRDARRARSGTVYVFPPTARPEGITADAVEQRTVANIPPRA